MCLVFGSLIASKVKQIVSWASRGSNRSRLFAAISSPALSKAPHPRAKHLATSAQPHMSATVVIASKTCPGIATWRSPLFLLSPGPATDLQEASPVQTSPEERRGASSCPRVPAHLPGALWWLQGSEGYVDFGPCYRCGSIQRLLGYISPLVPLLLASTNLSYIKELEVLQTRRAIRMAAPRARLQRTKTRAQGNQRARGFPRGSRP